MAIEKGFSPFFLFLTRFNTNRNDKLLKFE